MENPFVVADRQAKAKGFEQRTKNVHFAMPQNLPKHRMPTSSQPVRSGKRHPGSQATLINKKLEASGSEVPREKMLGKERIDVTAPSTRTTGANESREMSSTIQRTDDTVPTAKPSAIKGLNYFQEKSAANQKAKEAEESLAAPSTSTAASTPTVKRVDNLSGIRRQQNVLQSSRRPFASDESAATATEEKPSRFGTGVPGATKNIPTVSQEASAAEQGTPRVGEARRVEVRDSPTLRRVRVLARERGSEASEEVLEMDVEANPRHVPKVRISSPTSWMKSPRPNPGNLEGRFRQGASAGNPLDRAVVIPAPLFGGRNVNFKREEPPMRPARQETETNLETPQMMAKETAALATPSWHQDHVSRYESFKSLEAATTAGVSDPGTRNMNPLPTHTGESLAQREPLPVTAHEPLFGGQDRNSKGVESKTKRLREHTAKAKTETPQRRLPASDAISRRSDHRLNNESSQPSGIARTTRANDAVARSPSVSAVIRQAQCETPPWKLGDGLTEPEQSGPGLPPGATRGSQIGETESKAHGVSSSTANEIHSPATSKRETEPATEKTPVQEATHSNLCIRGLTIVLHMKDREDLVISTDLTRGMGTSQ